jgi:membrane protease YdiL (CAAX protease family)
MMDTLWRIVYIVLIGFCVYAFHKWIGDYPTPLPKSEKPKKEITEALLLWTVALIFPILDIYILSLWLDLQTTDKNLQELIYVPLRSIPYLILPLIVVLKQNWKRKDLGLMWRVQSPDVALAAVIFGLVSGAFAFINNQAVIGMEALPAGVFILLLYNNTFLEEFFHRGIIQSKLERGAGQWKAILFGGIMFGLTHIVFDINQLRQTQGTLFVFFAFVLQVLAGWLLGIIFMKTRSLWPGIACHYLANWLPSILNSVF